MAEKRMFSKKITDSDAFIEMPSSAQALYFHLNQGADDDGFNNQIRNAMFKAKASEDDLKVLLAKKFLIKFESGVIVIKHWRLHNTLRKDRYTPTSFQEELNTLQIKENGIYTQIDSGCQVVAKWLPDGCQTVTTDKYSIDKSSIDKSSIDDSATSNIIKTYEANIGIISPASASLLLSYLDTFNEEIICKAISKATIANIRTTKYICGILNDWRRKNVKTLADIETEQQEFEQNKNKTTKINALEEFMNESK